jgi:hypothetical protein
MKEQFNDCARKRTEKNNLRNESKRVSEEKKKRRERGKFRENPRAYLASAFIEPGQGI